MAEESKSDIKMEKQTVLYCGGMEIVSNLLLWKFRDTHKKKKKSDE